MGITCNTNVYFSTIELGNDNIKFIQDKWSSCLNEDTDFDTVVKRFKNAKTNAPSVYQHFKQYKLLHRETVHIKLFSKDGSLPNCKLSLL